MSILEILEAHKSYRTYIDRDDMAKVSCSCGDKDIKRSGMLADGSHRAHVAQVLEQHEREAKAEALEEAADEIERLENIGDTAQGELNEEQTAEYWLYHGTPKTTWLRDRAAQLKETP